MLHTPLFFKLNQAIFVAISFLLISAELNAQKVDLDQFYASSEPHASLGKSSKERLDSLYAAYLKEHSIDYDNGAYEEFIYEYNFFLENLNKSGKVFSGDVLTSYLNRLKNEILEGHPKKDVIHVYVTNFDQLNAFTNDFGNIYVNIATIAKIESEMQLRVILAHEIAHILKRHSFEMANLDNHFSDDKFEKINQISDFDTHKFSQNQELEADSIAYNLLINLGYDISNLEKLFDKLDESRNPVFGTPVHLSRLCLQEKEIYSNYLKSVDAKMMEDSLFSTISQNDSLSTHPSAEARKLLYQRIQKEGKASDKQNLEESEFEMNRLLAANVLVRTLMTEGQYIDGLYLVNQLMEKYPNDENLLKIYLKLQLLTTQSKYLFDESSILNNYGSSCSDSSYMIFRKGVLSIPALEMNILTISNVLEAQKKSNDAYLSRLSDFSYQFLYKYNPELITKLNGELALTDSKVNGSRIKKRPLSNSDQQEAYDEMRADGYIIVDSLFLGKELIKDFVTRFNAYDELEKNLYSYRQTRDQFEEMLTIDEFIVDFNPDESYEKFRKGKRNSAELIPESAQTALVQSDTYVFTRTRDKDIVIIDQNGSKGHLELRKEKVIDVKSTLEMQELVSEVLNESNYFKKDLTNLNPKEGAINVRDNYMHYLLTNWIDECLNFEELMYSSADEEIVDYLAASNMEYLVYNFNILHKNKSRKGKDSKYRCLYYNLYFNMQTMGVAYVSKIASSKKPKKKYLKHYFYQAHMGKSK